ncbi:GNAT family N-acetyltransferase [Streptomyces sp. 7N604]|uniref:GNAT family N-acetyltransferase n=1 Tax=Streptomyces sp. 7N604 TaxID=3457415 RepID=UPI003FD4011F
MAWITTDDLEEFLAAAGGFLRARPAQHTVLLTVTASLRASTRVFGAAPPEYGWWRAPDGRTAGAFLRTPPYPVLLSQMPGEAADDLAGVLVERERPTGGVNGGRAAAEAFAAGWQRRTGATARHGETNRLYRLGELTWPRPAPPGRARVAGPADRELLIEWYESFDRETSAHGGDHAGSVDDRLRYGGLTLWEVDGAIVSFAGVTRTIAGMARVAPVYTPQPLRGRGYAGAATAAVSGAALDSGAEEVLLFTDLANPTSNALYQRIGYRPVEDHLQLFFEPASSGQGAA